MTLFDERDEILVPDEGPGTELEGGDLAVVDELVERRPADAEHLGGVADGMYKWGLQNKVPLNLKEAGCIPLRSEVPPCSWGNHGECRAPRRCVLCSWDRPSGRVRPNFAPVTRAHLLHVVGARRPLGGQLSGMSYSPDRAATFDG